nr:unnamed protein product [Digitaria exilis]
MLVFALVSLLSLARAATGLDAGCLSPPPQQQRRTVVDDGVRGEVDALEALRAFMETDEDDTSAEHLLGEQHQPQCFDSPEAAVPSCFASSEEPIESSSAGVEAGVPSCSASPEECIMTEYLLGEQQQQPGVAVPPCSPPLEECEHPDV